MPVRKLALSLALTLLTALTAFSQSAPPQANYDEAKVGSYTLPDPLTLTNGTRVKDAKAWNQKRRPEIIRLFEENMQGRSPERRKDLSFEVFDKGTPAFDGKAIRKQVTIRFTKDRSGPKLDLLLYTPADTPKSVPVLLHLSFVANSQTVDDPGVKVGEIWNREKQKVTAPSTSRFAKLNVLEFLSRGIGVATFYYGDIEPDFEGGLAHGVRSLYSPPADDEWGAIGAWSWGLSRALDYLETDKAVDARRVAIMGVSRLGKTVLWAGAKDTRFAMVIACCSGEGGGSLSRRDYGETIKNIRGAFPFWFAKNYYQYAERVGDLGVDANMLFALIAPRPVYVSVGDQDKWSDPRGEFLAMVAGEPVYQLLGKKGLGTTELPAPNQPIMNTMGFHMHAGGHGTTPYDWEQYLKFMEMNLLPQANKPVK